jgi:short-subunit dehydrogenase/thioester reductase-like protein
VLTQRNTLDDRERLIDARETPDAVTILAGDVREPLLGLGAEQIDPLRGAVEHFFHLAARCEATAAPEEIEAVTVRGTRNAVALANTLGVAHFHHLSSVAVAGRHTGVFGEHDFELGQALPSPYHQAIVDAERIVREECVVPWRIYRPSIVVGDSQTGAIDKVDGPYHFFAALRKLAHLLPEWVPLAGPELGHTNIVPVDFVAAALDHIAHRDGLDGQAFHLVNPASQLTSEVFNAFARAAHGPTLALRVDRRMLDALPTGALALAARLPAVRAASRGLLAELEIPPQVLASLTFSCRFDASEAAAALEGSGIEVPPLDSYAARLWSYWESHLADGRGSAKSLTAALEGRSVLITGASSGIGRATAIKIAAAGGVPILVARDLARLEQTRAEIAAAGGVAHVYVADLADMDSVSALVKRVLAEHDVDVLVNNAGRSIRRSASLSGERFHDYERMMAVNYFGAIKLTLLLASHMRERGRGHVTNVSSLGVQASTPRYSAYVASKAALDAFTRVVSGELRGDGITFTTIHMPLVRTPMIAPTKLYESFPAITAEEAADMICESIRRKPKTMGTRLGTVAELSYTLAPGIVDRLLHAAYKTFPESAFGEGGEGQGDPARGQAHAVAQFLRGIRW